MFLLVYVMNPDERTKSSLISHISPAIQDRNGCESSKANLYSKTPSYQTIATVSCLPNFICSGDRIPRYSRLAEIHLEWVPPTRPKSRWVIENSDYVNSISFPIEFLFAWSGLGMSVIRAIWFSSPGKIKLVKMIKLPSTDLLSSCGEICLSGVYPSSSESDETTTICRQSSRFAISAILRSTGSLVDSYCP